MIPRRFAPLLFGLLVSGAMSFVVSGLSTWMATGGSDAFLLQWLRAWFTAWLLAFPLVSVIAPLARRLADRLTGPA